MKLFHSSLSREDHVEMCSMASTASSGSIMKGFSVLQPSLGAPLSWMPAVGTKELEQLINAYLPGPASAQEKRASISVDFFEFAAQTGENFKYYPVQFNATQAASPAMSNQSSASPSQPSTPASRTAYRAPAAKAEKTDYSHLPGMKILTTDGQDVTNSVSRGCKTKEQREHAHLMRVLKACDACKKKKIRCDPTHKRRSSSQTSAKAVSKPAKKAKKPPSSSAPASQAAAAAFTPAPETSFEFDLDMSLDIVLEGYTAMDIDDMIAFDPQPTSANMPQDYYGAVPQDFEFFLSNEFSPTTGSSSTGSFDSPAQPLTPVGSGLLSQGDFTAFNDTDSLAFLQAGGQEPSLPYMTTGAHGSDYVDFNLYSPAGSFIDEEPRKMKAGDKRKSSALETGPASPQSSLGDANNSPAGFDETGLSTGLAGEQQCRFDRSGGTITRSPQEAQWQVPSDQPQQVTTVGDPSRGAMSHGDDRPYNTEDGGHNRGRTTTAARPHGLQRDQQALKNSLVTATVPSYGLERSILSSGSLSPISPMSAPASSRVVSPRVGHQDEVRFGGGASALSRTISPSVCSNLSYLLSKAFLTDA